MQKKSVDRDAARRRVILDAARDCILKFGYAKCSLEDMAKKLSKPRVAWLMIPAGDPTEQSVGALGKLFAEAVENIDMNPVEGAMATGASWVASIRFAVLPQVISNFVSYALLRFEINVRSAAVMGFVGAGGIGLDLMVAIRKLYYTDVSAILLLIVATVMIIDLATERLRHWLIGWEQRA